MIKYRVRNVGKPGQKPAFFNNLREAKEHGKKLISRGGYVVIDKGTDNPNHDLWAPISFNVPRGKKK